jgi:hypothetical protein
MKIIFFLFCLTYFCPFTECKSTTEMMNEEVSKCIQVCLECFPSKENDDSQVNIYINIK